MHHSPSGAESEINQYLIEQFTALGVEVWQDRADNIIAKIPGKSSEYPIAITAHKDEIGAIVKTVGEAGIIEVRKLGGSYPWVYGEGVVDLLGDKETIKGVLSFGSRHVSHESPRASDVRETGRTGVRNCRAHSRHQLHGHRSGPERPDRCLARRRIQRVHHPDYAGPGRCNRRLGADYACFWIIGETFGRVL